MPCRAASCVVYQVRPCSQHHAQKGMRAPIFHQSAARHRKRILCPPYAAPRRKTAPSRHTQCSGRISCQRQPAKSPKAVEQVCSTQQGQQIFEMTTRFELRRVRALFVAQAQVATILGSTRAHQVTAQVSKTRQVRWRPEARPAGCGSPRSRSKARSTGRCRRRKVFLPARGPQDQPRSRSRARHARCFRQFSSFNHFYDRHHPCLSRSMEYRAQNVDRARERDNANNRRRFSPFSDWVAHKSVAPAQMVAGTQPSKILAAPVPANKRRQLFIALNLVKSTQVFNKRHQCNTKMKTALRMAVATFSIVHVFKSIILLHQEIN